MPKTVLTEERICEDAALVERLKSAKASKPMTVEQFGEWLARL